MNYMALNLGNFLFLNEKTDGEIIVPKVKVKKFLNFLKLNPEQRFELIDGKIIPMSNTTPMHGLILSNFNRLIGNYLFDKKSPCRAFTDIQCKIDEYNCPHPDIVVVCNQSIYSKLLEYPTIVGEVFSSNRKNDETKLARYKDCVSIQEILMIEQNKMQITCYKKDMANVWTSQIYHENDTILLNSIGFSVNVKDIYYGITFNKI